MGTQRGGLVGIPFQAQVVASTKQFQDNKDIYPSDGREKQQCSRPHLLQLSRDLEGAVDKPAEVAKLLPSQVP